jgi:hypothetical protein
VGVSSWCVLLNYAMMHGQRNIKLSIVSKHTTSNVSRKNISFFRNIYSVDSAATMLSQSSLALQYDSVPLYAAYSDTENRHTETES